MSATTTPVEVGQCANARSAHREWASRPADERYRSFDDLEDAARRQAIRYLTVKHEPHTLRLEALDESTLSIDRLLDDDEVRLTHWSFGQLASMVGAPAAYIRTLPAPIAAEALQYGLARMGDRGTASLLLESGGGDLPFRLRALTSPHYTRVYNHQILSQIRSIIERHPAWELPLAYSRSGGDMEHAGAYLGDRDMFLFMVDQEHAIDDPTDASHQGMFRGWILRNSEVGAAALTFDAFLFRKVCGNHLIWGFQHILGMRRRHVGKITAEQCGEPLRQLSEHLTASSDDDMKLLSRAITRELGTSRQEVLEAAARLTELPE